METQVLGDGIVKATPLKLEIGIVQVQQQATSTPSPSIEQEQNQELEESRAECLRLKKEVAKLTQELGSLKAGEKFVENNGNNSHHFQIRCKGYLGMALLKALETRSSARIVELLARRADLNYRDTNGVPALSYSAMFGCPPAVIKHMLDRGADVNAVDNYGMTPLFRAIENDEFAIAQLLLENGAEVNFGGLHANKTPLMLAAERGQTNFVKLLINHGANVDLANNNGWTALIYAAITNNLEVGELLVDNGANVNARTSLTQSYRSFNHSQSNRGNRIVKNTTPLMIAVERNNYDFVLLLLSSGADLSGVNEDGDTALALANRDEIKLALREALHSFGSS